MNWDEIIERNRERLLLAIAPLLAVLGFDQRRREEVPRHFHSFLITLLRPAEFSCQKAYHHRRHRHRGEAADWRIEGLPGRACSKA